MTRVYKWPLKNNFLLRMRLTTVILKTVEYQNGLFLSEKEIKI
jgi:hypothetical protein